MTRGAALTTLSRYCPSDQSMDTNFSGDGCETTPADFALTKD
jgi:hypothetical protein